jgi:hypothetical protein
MSFDFSNGTSGISTNGSRFDNGLTNAESWLVLVGGFLGFSLLFGLLFVVVGRCSDAAERAGTMFFCCRRCNKKSPAEQNSSAIDEESSTDNNPNSPKVSAGAESRATASSPLLV